MSVAEEDVQEIINTLNEAYNEADEALSYLNDDDPLSSDVATCINNGYSQAEYARDNISWAINALEALDYDETTEDQIEAIETPKKEGICYTCGNRN